MKIVKYILIIALSLPASIMFAGDHGHSHGAGGSCGGHSGPAAPSSPRRPQPGADNPFPAAQRANAGDRNTSASPQRGIGESIFITVAGGFIMTLANEAVRAWLHPENPETKEFLSISDLDKIISNTEHQIHSLHKTMETTRDPLVAPQCRKEIERAEKLIAQTTALRNQRLGRLMANATARESLNPSTPK